MKDLIERLKYLTTDLGKDHRSGDDFIRNGTKQDVVDAIRDAISALSEAEKREKETLTQLSELAENAAEDLVEKWTSDLGATVDTKAAGVAAHIITDFHGHIEAALSKIGRSALQSEGR